MSFDKNSYSCNNHHIQDAEYPRPQKISHLFETRAPIPFSQATTDLISEWIFFHKTFSSNRHLRGTQEISYVKSALVLDEMGQI